MGHTEPQDRTPEGMRLTKLPPCPARLKAPEAIEEWERCGEALVAYGLLTFANVTLFEQRCLLWGELCGLWNAGKAVGSGRISLFRQLTADLKIMATDFGKPAAVVPHETPPAGPVKQAPMGARAGPGGPRRRIRRHREVPREPKAGERDSGPAATGFGAFASRGGS